MVAATRVQAEQRWFPVEVVEYRHGGGIYATCNGHAARGGTRGLAIQKLLTKFINLGLSLSVRGGDLESMQVLMRE